MQQLLPIPQPKKYGPLGNLPLIDVDSPSLSFGKLFAEHGPIFRFEALGRSTIMIADPELVADACDESRFDKNIGHLKHVRTFAGDGLFTAWTEEENWRKAHQILMPAFSQPAMKGYHAMMIDIAMQLVQKWTRLNPGEDIDVPDDMTRLTLDTIGLCGFNYRFNSYYRETPNPFIESMVRALDEAMHKGNRIPLVDQLMVRKKHQFEQDIQAMYGLVDRLIAERKSRGDQGEVDLLARMLSVKDPETGVRLDDENIRHQIITFLIAGHETTSGLLSFAIYFLLNHPDVLERAYDEVDTVVTSETPSYQEVLQLRYIRMVLNESLRLWPTAPAFAVYAKEDTTLGGKYAVKKGEVVLINIPTLHRDKGAWGDDADQFRPERFEDPNQIPTYAYKPFGNGQRACIGMQFALHEATLVLAMILQQFKLVDHTGYQLKVRQTLTLKPEDFFIRVALRDRKMVNGVTTPSKADNEETKHHDVKPNQGKIIGLNHRSLLVLYGSDMGTAEQIANELADTAQAYGVHTEVAALDERIGKWPKDGAVFIVTSSYNGKPPRNARQFVDWLGQAKQDELNGVHYSVFGCGDRNWASTYQAIPRFIDEKLAEKGATRFSKRGEADMSADFEKQLDAWKQQMWGDAIKAFDLKLENADTQEKPTLHVEFVRTITETPLVHAYHAGYATVVENRELQSPKSSRSTRHIQLELSNNISYQEGDHLGVLPYNHQDTVQRVLRRFKLRETDTVILTANGMSVSHLPLDRPVSISALLSQSVELQETATRAQIREVAASTTCPPHQRALQALIEDGTYESEILKKHVTMLDLLEKYEACEMSFERFLSLLPSLKPRYYSISSSPRLNEKRASITVAVVHGEARSGHGEYRGVASNYLAERQIGNHVAVFVRTPQSGFELPSNSRTPIIMVGPGTGVAPFRGFLQARAILKESGHELGEAHLYFGCRSEQDYLYRDELEQYEQDGLVELHVGFSREKNTAKTYVQDIMHNHAEKLIQLLEEGARLYVCGDGSRMAPDVERELMCSYQSVHQVSDTEAQTWLNHLQTQGQYAKDVWSGL